MKRNSEDASGESVGYVYGTVPAEEHLLIVRGLDCLKVTLLNEAGAFGEVKVTKRRGRGSMGELVDTGIERLEQLTILNRLNQRLQAMPPVPLPTK